MEKKPKRILKFITFDKAEKYPENGLGGLGGMFKKGMRWEDYKPYYTNYAHEELEQLRSKILENEIRCSGEDHQYNSKSVPLWSDKTVDTYSYRAWGDLMAAIYSTQENKDYCYIDFYVDCPMEDME